MEIQTTISETIDDNREITIEISPTSNKRDIEKIIGQFGKYSCQLSKDEIEKLTNYIKGVKGSLSDKVSFHVRCSVDPKGQFQLFITGLATTMVQFKLWGRVFPGEPLFLPSQIMNGKVFKQLSKYKTDNPLLKNWISKMISFWNGWGYMFDQDKDLKQEIRELKMQMMELKKEVVELKKEVNILQCHNIKI